MEKPNKVPLWRWALVYLANSTPEQCGGNSRIDLRGADLTGAYLSGASLWGADFRGANLRAVKDFTAPNVKRAKNWRLAFYSDGCLKELGLPPVHNKTVKNKLAELEMEKNEVATKN